MELFYSPDIFSTLSLPEEESKHCVRVLRHTVGDEINIIDGRGGMFKAKIVDAHQKRVLVEIVSAEKNFAPLPYKLHMAVAPTKNIDRYEWYAEKATEIGLHSLTPVLCRFSERKVVKDERTEKILLAATKQSLKAFLPRLSEMVDSKKFIETAECKNKFIAHCYADIQKEHLFDVCPKGEEVLVMVGPEGDFSREEVELAMSCGFQSISLGTSRLRTETAGVVAAEIVALKNR